MLVREIMSTDVVACDASASLRRGVESMLRNRIGSVIVTDGGGPAGIVTETDCIHAGYVTDAPFSEIPIRKVMSSPLETIAPSKPARTAWKSMKDRRVKKLIVLDGLDVVGVLTATDLVNHYPELTAEIHEIERVRDRHAPETSRFDLE